jgi:glycosyltransferase involved in cell wall biosynthesis
VQTRPPDEVVISDDGSTDGTIELVSEFARFAKFPVNTVRNASTKGWSENFLEAISLCTGDWIALCDQDDVWAPTKLSCIQEHIQAESNESNVVMWVHSSTVTDERLTRSRMKYPLIRRSRIINGAALPPWWVAPGFAIVFRAELVLPLREVATERGADPAHPAALLAHDRYICQLSRSIGSVGMLRDNLALYRRHAGSATSFLRRKSGRLDASVGGSTLIRQALDMAGVDFYRRHAETAMSLKRVCGLLAEDARFKKWRNAFLKAKGDYDAYADWLNLRANIYRDLLVVDRLKYLWRTIRERGYWKFYGHWWLRGLRALTKDCLVALVGFKRIHPRGWE